MRRQLNRDGGIRILAWVLLVFVAGCGGAGFGVGGSGSSGFDEAFVISSVLDEGTCQQGDGTDYCPANVQDPGGGGQTVDADVPMDAPIDCTGSVSAAVNEAFVRGEGLRVRGSVLQDACDLEVPVMPQGFDEGTTLYVAVLVTGGDEIWQISEVEYDATAPEFTAEIVVEPPSDLPPDGQFDLQVAILTYDEGAGEPPPEVQTLSESGASSVYVTPEVTVIADPPPTPEATPSPTPTAVPTGTPAPTETPMPTVEPTPGPSAGATPTPVRTAGTTPTPSRTAGSTPTPVRTIGATPTPVRTISATPTPARTARPSPTPVRTFGPRPSNGPRPTDMPRPTASPSDRPVPTKTPDVRPEPTGGVRPTPTPRDTNPTPKPSDTNPTPRPSDTDPTPKPSDTDPTPKPSDTDPVRTRWRGARSPVPGTGSAARADAASSLPPPVP